MVIKRTYKTLKSAFFDAEIGQQPEKMEEPGGLSDFSSEQDSAFEDSQSREAEQSELVESARTPLESPKQR